MGEVLVIVEDVAAMSAFLRDPFLTALREAADARRRCFERFAFEVEVARQCRDDEEEPHALFRSLDLGPELRKDLAAVATPEMLRLSKFADYVDDVAAATRRLCTDLEHEHAARWTEIERGFADFCADIGWDPATRTFGPTRPRPSSWRTQRR